MSEKMLSRVDLVVVANGYKVREFSGLQDSPFMGEYVFSNLDDLFEFLKKNLLVPIEHRNNNV